MDHVLVTRPTLGLIEDAMVAWLEQELKAPPLASVEIQGLVSGYPPYNEPATHSVRIFVRTSGVRQTPDLIFTVSPGCITITCGYTRLEATITITPSQVVMDKMASNRVYELADPQLLPKLRADIYMMAKLLTMGAL